MLLDAALGGCINSGYLADNSVLTDYVKKEINKKVPYPFGCETSVRPTDFLPTTIVELPE